MIHRPYISTCISRSVISIFVLLLAALPAEGQKLFKLEKDSIPLMRGFQVSFDLVGAAQMMLSDYGQYEGALRLNLHDQWFPVFELGIGKANHEDDEVTDLSYKTNRLFAGFRYAYTSYKVDVWNSKFTDPVWKWPVQYEIRDANCYQHWAEVVFGLDAQIWGPAHLGWSVRYRQRLSHNEEYLGSSWYVPGYGTQDTSNIGATFNVIIDI